MESYQYHSIEEKDEAPTLVVEDVASSDISSTTQFTPKTGFTFGPQEFGSAPRTHDTLLGDIPWYDKTYMILDKQTRKAITYTETNLFLCEITDGPNASNSWLCVSRDNFTGFLNKKSRFYLGHDRKKIGSRVHANALECDETESFIPRVHPKGGFLLLSAQGKQMRVLVKTSKGTIERAFHGDTLWVFEEV